jgi:hypothetical protein
MRVHKAKAFSAWLFASALFSSGASAVLPDSGWYYNSNEPGRGFNIEIQGDTLFMAGFLYDAKGNPIWVVSSGPMVGATVYSGAAYQTANGQPLGGAYHAPTMVPLTPYGNATVVFTTSMTATITVNGYTFTVAREQFGFDFSDPAQPLLGEFAFVSGDPSQGAYFGERVTLSGTQVNAGTPVAVGNRTGETGANNVAVGMYSPPLGLWTVLLDSSPNYYSLYNFYFEGDNLVEGAEYTYLKGSSPTSGTSFIGHRIRSAKAAAGGDGPGVVHEMKRPAAPLGTDSYAAAKASVQTPMPLGPAQLDAVHQLEAVLQSVR